MSVVYYTVSSPLRNQQNESTRLMFVCAIYHDHCAMSYSDNAASAGRELRCCKPSCTIPTDFPTKRKIRKVPYSSELFPILKFVQFVRNNYDIDYIVGQKRTLHHLEYIRYSKVRVIEYR